MMATDRHAQEGCASIGPFVDGALSTEEADAFRVHLATCRKCQDELEDLLQLAALEIEAEQRGIRPRPRTRRRGWPRGLLTFALASALAGVVFMVVPQSGSDPCADWQAGRYRHQEGRLSYACADRHRPYDVKRGAAVEASEAVPESVVHALHQQQQHHGEAAAHFLRGELDTARTVLGRAADSVDVRSDRALLLLSKGKVEEALNLIDEILEEHPRHVQALWNRGVALQHLGLPLLAAESFAAVAQKKEPGWSEEAAEISAELRRTTERRGDSYRAMWRAGQALIRDGKPLPPIDESEFPGTLRVILYDAARAATSPAQAQQLLPLAERLDRLYGGGGVLQRYVRKVAQTDFARRGPLSQRYAQLAINPDALSQPEQERLLQHARDSGQDDILLGALVHTGLASRHIDEFQRLAQGTKDPWFDLLAEQEAALSERQAGKLIEARDRLQRALGRCEALRLEFRCAYLEYWLIHIYFDLRDLRSVWSHARRGWDRTRRMNEWRFEFNFLQLMDQATSFRGDFSLSRAYALEAQRREPDDCRLRQHVYTNLATLDWFRRGATSWARASEEIAEALRCGPLPAAGLLTLVDLRRAGHAVIGDSEMRANIAHLRGKPGKTPGEDMILDAIEGRLLLELDRRAGLDLLQHAIRRANERGQQGASWDYDATLARHKSYASLIFDAARAGRITDALTLMAEDARTHAPERCLLAIAQEDERTLVVARGEHGEVDHELQTGLGSVDPGKIIPAGIHRRLASCPTVAVLASPLLQGQERLLPDAVAWSYQVSPAPATERPATACTVPRRVIIKATEPPARLGLPPLRMWQSAGVLALDRELSGLGATPTRVKAQIGDATEIEIHAHGIIDTAVSEATIIALAPEDDQVPERFEWTADEVRKMRLRCQPIVILAVCEGGRAAPHYRHEPFSLPAAFLSAGAKLVLASSGEVSDHEAPIFFAAVRDEIRRGVVPAQALRDVRLREHWRNSPWTRKVQLFQ